MLDCVNHAGAVELCTKHGWPDKQHEGLRMPHLFDGRLSP